MEVVGLRLRSDSKCLRSALLQHTALVIHRLRHLVVLWETADKLAQAGEYRSTQQVSHPYL